MPTYTYTCTSCNDVVEKRQSFSDPPLTTCEECGGTLRKIIHPVGIVFKGSGWYSTDSRASNSGATASNAAGGSDAKDSAPKDGGSSTDSGSKDGKGSKDSSTPADSGSKESSPSKAGATPTTAPTPKTSRVSGSDKS